MVHESGAQQAGAPTKGTTCKDCRVLTKAIQVGIEGVQTKKKGGPVDAGPPFSD
jgi:hypothetical protein